MERIYHIHCSNFEIVRRFDFLKPRIYRILDNYSMLENSEKKHFIIGKSTWKTLN